MDIELQLHLGIKNKIKWLIIGAMVQSAILIILRIELEVLRVNKVLRTRKITENNWNKDNVWSVFCSQGCYTDFFYKHWAAVIAIAPRTEPLETPIEVRVEDRQDYFGRPYKQKVIVDRPTEDVVG